MFFCLCCDQPDGEAGDVIVVLQQTSHSFFRREELDLFVDKKITLRQALCGFSFSFEHLDGRKIKVACSPGEVLSPSESGVTSACCMCRNKCSGALK